VHERQTFKYMGEVYINMTKNITLNFDGKDVELEISDNIAAIGIILTQIRDEIQQIKERIRI